MSTHLTTYTMTKLPRRRYTKTLQDYQFAQPLKDTTRPYSPMGKQEPEKHTPWRALNTICMIRNEELYPELFKTFSGTYNLVKTKM